MPSLEWNKERWGKEHDWSAHGDEWSYSFGSASVHWYAFMLPRIHRFLPDATSDSRIVEIAPGHGRWTQFLLMHCKKLAAYDVTEECISYCNRRFTEQVARGTVEFHLNDGLTLSETDNSVDFAFSFDSLVHVERNVVQSYLHQVRKCLKPGAVAFLQHSNLGSYPHLYQYNKRIPFHARGSTVSADTVREDARKEGLITLVQEGLNHETQSMNNELLDCISLLQKPLHQYNGKQAIFLENKAYSEIGHVSKVLILPYEVCEIS